MQRLIIVAAFVAVANAASLSLIQPHLAGGKDVVIEDYPYQVTISVFGSPVAGGVIVSSKHVVTAAHFVSTSWSDKYKVRVGSSSFDDKEGTLIDIVKFNHHPKYVESAPYAYDVSVALLKEQIKFGANAHLIHLVSVNNEPKPGDMVTLTGWANLDYTGDTPETLQAAEIPIVSREECREIVSDRTDDKLVTDYTICAGGNLKGIRYNGDVGAPVINKKKELVGVACTGLWSRDPLDPPGVFTSVAYPEIHDFITENIKTLN